MSRRTYLSIDLDYWASLRTAGRQMREFLDKALQLEVPTLVVRDHHHLVSHANRFDCDHLINVDYHDDLVHREPLMHLEEGNWVSFIRWRRGGHYEWRRPHEWPPWHGVCDGAVNLYGQYYYLSGWSRISRMVGTGRIPWDDIAAVGISISPNYLYGDYVLFVDAIPDWCRGTVEKLLRERPGHVDMCRKYRRVLRPIND